MAKEVKTNPTDAAEKWGRRLKQAGTDISRGVDRVTESPMEAAADQQDKMLRNLTDAVNNGKWRNGLLRVSLNDWQSAMTEIGINRIPQGVDRASAKVQDFFRDLFAHENDLLTDIDAMPDVTLEDGVNRAVAWIRGMGEFQRGV